MIERLTGESLSTRPVTTLDHALSWLDLVLAVVAFTGAAGLVLVVAVPGLRAWDPVGFGIIGAMLLLPYGLVALAAWHAMRRRERGRWILQGLTLLPVPLGGALLLLR
jgi:hypothetical protein